jgi:ATP-dependent RNA helicase DDX10/DBP4
MTPQHCCVSAQELAQRALVSYMRATFLQPNKAVFDVAALPAAEYAASLGLASAPRLRFLKRVSAQAAAKAADAGTGAAGALADESEDDVSDDDETGDDINDGMDGEAAEARRCSGAGAGTSRGAAAVAIHAEADRPEEVGGGDSEGDSDDGGFVVKRRNVHDVDLSPELPEEIPTSGEPSGT